MMYMSRAVPRQEMWRNPELLSMFKSSYALHKAVWNFFLGDPDRKRDFLFRCDSMHGQPVIYILSAEKPVSQSGAWVVDTKEFSPVLQNGDRLSFTVRVNPVVTKTYKDEKTGKDIHKRHDVVMNRTFEAREQGITLSYNEVVNSAGYEWLAVRAEKHGFKVSPSSVIVDRYEKKTFEKSTPSGKISKVVLGILDIRGVLEVTDSDAFVEMLYAGLGPAKGFGNGLMLVKRV